MLIRTMVCLEMRVSVYFQVNPSAKHYNLNPDGLSSEPEEKVSGFYFFKRKKKCIFAVENCTIFSFLF